MESYKLFLALGGLLLVGLIADQIGRQTRLPRVTLIKFGLAYARKIRRSHPPGDVRWHLDEMFVSINGASRHCIVGHYRSSGCSGICATQVCNRKGNYPDALIVGWMGSP